MAHGTLAGAKARWSTTSQAPLEGVMRRTEPSTNRGRVDAMAAITDGPVARTGKQVGDEPGFDGNGYFSHALSDVQTSRIGFGTRIWQFTVVLSGAEIGRNVNICSHCFIENDVVVGNDVTVKSGVQLWDGVRLEDEVFIGPNVSFGNDTYPRSGNRQFQLRPTIVRRGASIGAGAVLLPGIVVGEYAMVGAGAIVTKDVPAGATVVGNPAKRVRSAIAPTNE